MDQFSNLSTDKMKVSVFARNSIYRLPEEEINKMMEVLTGVSSFAGNSKNDMVVNFIFPNFYLHPDDAKKIKRLIEEEMDGCLVHSSSALLVLVAEGGWRISVHLGGSLKGFGTSPPGIGVLDGIFAEANHLLFDENYNSTTSSSLMDSNDSLGLDNLTQDVNF